MRSSDKDSCCVWMNEWMWRLDKMNNIITDAFVNPTKRCTVVFKHLLCLLISWQIKKWIYNFFFIHYEARCRTFPGMCCQSGDLSMVYSTFICWDQRIHIMCLMMLYASVIYNNNKLDVFYLKLTLLDSCYVNFCCIFSFTPMIICLMNCLLFSWICEADTVTGKVIFSEWKKDSTRGERLWMKLPSSCGL